MVPYTHHEPANSTQLKSTENSRGSLGKGEKSSLVHILCFVVRLSNSLIQSVAQLKQRNTKEMLYITSMAIRTALYHNSIQTVCSY